MPLILIGILLFVIITMTGQGNPQMKRFAALGKAVAVVLIAAGIMSSAIVQIEAGTIGVQSLFGKVQNNTLEPGLNFVNPLVKVTRFDTKTQNYTMSGVHDEGSKMGDDAIRVLSQDGLEVVIDVTVLYRVQTEKAPQILKEIGTDYRNIIVRPMVRTKLRDNAVYYDAVSLYSTKRDEFQNRIFEGVKEEFASRGLTLESMLVRNIMLPESVKLSIESKINAEQDAQKMTFVLQKEKQEAERKRVEAQGIADYQRILNTGLSDKLLQYEMIKANKEIALSPNAKTIIMSAGKSVPIILNEKD